MGFNSLPGPLTKCDMLSGMAQPSVVLTLYSKSLSACHDAKCLIVRSRDGGMVSKNCIDCGKPYYISPPDFPDIPCPLCRKLFVVRKTDGRNYFFECVRCQKEVQVSFVVPDWSDHFRYSGLAAFGDNIPF